MVCGKLRRVDEARLLQDVIEQRCPAYSTFSSPNLS
jgi:hypothetical protein